MLENGAVQDQSRSVHFRVGPLLRPTLDAAAVSFDPHSGRARGVCKSGLKIIAVWLDYQYRMRFCWGPRETIIIERGFRDQLIDSKRYRLAELSWQATARHFLAIYKALGKRELTPDDRAVLTKEPLL
jgi:hypothetical protein